MTLEGSVNGGRSMMRSCWCHRGYPVILWHGSNS